MNTKNTDSEAGESEGITEAESLCEIQTDVSKANRSTDTVRAAHNATCL